MNIIQTYKSYDDIPAKLKSLVNKVQEYNPDCNYIFFSDKDIMCFISSIKELNESYYETFFSLKYKIQQLDFFRYLAIYYYGGLYLDIDIEVYTSFDDLDRTRCAFPNEMHNNSDIILQRQGMYNLIGNYAFYAPQYDPFIKKIIDNIVTQRIPDENIPKNYNSYVYYTTGPVLVSQTYIDYTDKNKVDIIEPNPFKRSCFGKYGKHLNYGSWK
jgi:mannosyltransferase OCH1-like enzyme